MNIGFDRLYKEYSATYKDYEKVLITIGEILNDYLELFEVKTIRFGLQGENYDFENLKYYLNKGIKAVKEENKLLE